EFVAAQACDDIARTDVLLQALANRSEQEIPDAVAERIVVPLEAIQMYDQQRHAALGVNARLTAVAQARLEVMAIREAREVVVVGQMQQLGVPALGQRAHEIDGAADAKIASL